MNTAINTTGLGAAITPAVLAEPIDFYAVAGQLYYRHAGTGRVFRLRLDLAAIDRINEMDDDTLDKLTSGDVQATARIEEGPPDVIAHSGAVPLADWQIDAWIGSDPQSSDGLGDLIRDLADEADEHVTRYPLAELAPFQPIAPVLQMTAEIVLSTLADLGRATAVQVAAALKDRGVIVIRGAAAALEYLGEQGFAEFTGGTWLPSEAGRKEAAKVRASLAALAGG